jgi:hypothetical protein
VALVDGLKQCAATVVLLASCGTAPVFEPAPPRDREGSAASSVQAVLEGDRDAFDDAVARLYVKRDEPSSAAALARLLNLPLSEGDLRYASLQRQLYGDLLEQHDSAVTRGFYVASTAAEAYQNGRTAKALSILRRLESELAAEATRNDDVDLHAMLGNYAHQAGGLVPLRREHRFELAREHLEHAVLRFDEMSPEAQGVTLGIPGVRPVFAMWWAELLYREGDPRAEEAYALVREVAAEAEQTPALAVLVDATRDRSRETGPLWPHGYDSCVACHSRTQPIARR